MKNRLRTFAALTGGAFAGLVLAAVPLSADPATDRAAFENQMDADMARMMHDMHSPGYTGDPDIDFLVMMIPHHQGAVDMAKLVLVHGVDPQTRALAEDIIAAQVTEIEAMTARLKVLLEDDPTKVQTFPALTGLRGSGD